MSEAGIGTPVRARVSRTPTPPKAALLLAALLALSVLVGCSNTPEVAQTTEIGQGSQDSTEAPQASDTQTAAVSVYFTTAGSAAFAVSREVTAPSVARGAMEQLLAGPTPQELSTWPALATEIPDGTRLLDISVEDGVATLDLSEEFEQGAGAWSVTARVAQVVYTLTQFDTVDAVVFLIEGEPVEALSGEGLLLDGPQTPEDFEGAVPIDA